MLHSCFSDESDGDGGDWNSDAGHSDDEVDAIPRLNHGLTDSNEEGEDRRADMHDAASITASICSGSICSVESAVGERDSGILARTALVARAQRVKVRSPGLKKGVEGGEA